MRVFITGASGWIGSAVVPELLGAGHEVVGLARSDASAAVDHVGRRRGVPRGHSMTRRVFATASTAATASSTSATTTTSRTWTRPRRRTAAVIEAIGSVLEHSDRPFVVAGGVLGLAPGRVATENDVPDAELHPRIANVQWTLSLADRGVRSSCVRFAPTVHGDGDHGFIATLVAIARAKGASGYIDDGANRWSAVHRLDAARLVRLALEGAPAGTSVHAVAEQGIATKSIAEAIGAGLGVPVVSMASDDAAEHFGWMARFFGADATATNAITRALLDWEPTHQGLLEDLSEGHYFR